MHKFELKRDGSVVKVGPFGSIGPVIDAQNKTEAAGKFLAFAFRALGHTPEVRVANGAYQLAYVSLTGVNVESGVEGRKFCLCMSNVSDWSSLNDGVASFDYYSSAQYRDNMAA